MNTFSHVPPGFRFHPTDGELVDYYLRKKINARKIDLDVIKDVDLYKIEPWDLQELCTIIGSEEENEWYFFSHKDKKYPTGTRTNRATTAGFWKATGRDKAIYNSSNTKLGHHHDLIGMRKTLVFYKGRAPNGQKSDWIMHEYRLETDETGTTTQEEGWVVCRVFKKKITTFRRVSEQQESSSSWPYDHDHDHPLSFINNINEHHHHHHHSPNNQNHLSYNSSKKDFNFNFHYHNHQFPQNNNHFLHLPLLDHQINIPNNKNTNSSISPYGFDINQTINLPSSSLTTHDDDEEEEEDHEIKTVHHDDDDQVTTTDWRVLDKFVASQLSQEDMPKLQTNIINIFNKEDTHELENASASASQIQLWKS